MKKILLFIFCFLIFQCEEKKSVKNKDEEAKLWLIKSINDYFSTQNKSDLRNKEIAMTTKDYYEFKSDAININTEKGLTKEQFYNKWKGIYDTNSVKLNSSFLNPEKDWVKIEVDECKLISRDENSFLFDTSLRDEGVKYQYQLQILVTETNSEFKINYVYEN